MRHFDASKLKRHVDVPFNSSEAPPTTTISGAGFLKGWIKGLLESFAYKVLLSIEKAEPLSTSASRTCTESRIASVNCFGAPTQPDSTT